MVWHPFFSFAFSIKLTEYSNAETKREIARLVYSRLQLLYLSCSFEIRRVMKRSKINQRKVTIFSYKLLNSWIFYSFSLITETWSGYNLCGSMISIRYSYKLFSVQNVINVTISGDSLIPEFLDILDTITTANKVKDQIIFFVPVTR